MHFAIYVTYERFIAHYMHDYLLTFSIDLHKFAVENLLVHYKRMDYLLYSISITKFVHRIDLIFFVNTLHQITASNHKVELNLQSKSFLKTWYSRKSGRNLMAWIYFWTIFINPEPPNIVIYVIYSSSLYLVRI